MEAVYVRKMVRARVASVRHAVNRTSKRRAPRSTTASNPLVTYRSTRGGASRTDCFKRAANNDNQDPQVSSETSTPTPCRKSAIEARSGIDMLTRTLKIFSGAMLSLALSAASPAIADMPPTMNQYMKQQYIAPPATPPPMSPPSMNPSTLPWGSPPIADLPPTLNQRMAPNAMPPPSMTPPMSTTAVDVFGIPGLRDFSTPSMPDAMQPTAPPFPRSQQAAPENIADDLTPEERATVAIFDRNTPSVVNIANLAAYTRGPYAMDATVIPQGTGSGFIWDGKGHVVTNFHVVKGASALKVALYDSTSCSAKVVGVDENKDIAVLKLDLSDAQARKLQRVDLGRSTGLAVGQRVYAIGNPFGLDHTLTSGVVSGLQREIQATSYGPKIKGVIQTDAAINPGNSGGVLLNSKGKLIGVNSAILDPSQRGAFSGVGFAIPIDMVKGLVEQILEYGQVIRPVLGITMGPPALIARLNIDGVLVYSAPTDGPAGVSGVQGCQRTQYGDFVLGDIIVGMNGKKVRNYADLFEVLDECKPGDNVSLDLYRPLSRERLTVQVLLGQRSQEIEIDG